MEQKTYLEILKILNSDYENKQFMSLYDLVDNIKYQIDQIEINNIDIRIIKIPSDVYTEIDSPFDDANITEEEFIQNSNLANSTGAFSLANYIKDCPCYIFIHEELLKFLDKKMLDFVIQHEIGHILTMSNFGDTEFNVSTLIHLNKNLNVVMKNIKEYLNKRNMNRMKIQDYIEKIKSKNLSYAMRNIKLFYQLTDSDNVLIEDAANIYAMEKTKSNDFIKYIYNNLKDLYSIQRQVSKNKYPKIFLEQIKNAKKNMKYLLKYNYKKHC